MMKLEVNRIIHPQPISLIQKIEKHFDAQMVVWSKVKRKFSDAVPAGFLMYQKYPAVELGHEHYFCVFPQNDAWYVTSASQDQSIAGVVVGDAFHYSATVHDYYSFGHGPYGEYFVDGGRDYLRTNCVDTGVIDLTPEGPILSLSLDKSMKRIDVLSLFREPRATQGT